MLLALASDQTLVIRVALTSRRLLYPDVVAVLLADPGAWVRRALARGGHPDAAQVRALATDLGEADLFEQWRWAHKHRPR